jgi:hypothetical protein
MTASRTIIVTGAGGGQGASTVAAALALFGAREQPTELVTHDADEMTALLGLTGTVQPQTPTAVTPQLDLVGEKASGRSRLVVIDAGRSPDAAETPDEAERYVVVQGPCYLALRRLVRAEPDRYDGVILVNEPGRSLRAADVAEVLGVPVVAEVAHHPAVARAIDAGLLPARIDRLQPLSALRVLALAPPRRNARRHAPAVTRTRPPALTSTPGRTERSPEESSKDLPCPLFRGHGGRGPVGRVRIGGVRGRSRRPREETPACSASAGCDMGRRITTSAR